MSVAQALTVGAVYFFLFRFVLRQLGVDKLGVWSIVLATTSVGQVANLGLSGGVVKFVASYLARNDRRAVCEIIQTATLSIAAVTGVAALALFPIARWVIVMILPETQHYDAIAILPYSLLGFWLVTTATVLNSGLDGLHRIDLRNCLVIATTLLNLGLAYTLVPQYGLMGLAYAHVIHSGVLLVAAWIMLKSQLPQMPVISFRWTFGRFRELLAYGINLQVITFSTILLEPVTKGLLAVFGSLATVGYYEMASRMITQLRAVITSANQVLVPTFAELKETDLPRLREMYRRTYLLLTYVTPVPFVLVVLLTPMISGLWIGAYEPQFVWASWLLAGGWFVNVLAAPAYFTNLGTGELRWNVIAHLAMLMFIAMVGTALGALVGAYGVIVAMTASLAVGGAIILLSYHHHHNHSLCDLWPRESYLIGAASLATVAVGLALHRLIHDLIGLMETAGILMIVCMLILAVPLWIHPARKRLAASLAWSFLGRRQA